MTIGLTYDLRADYLAEGFTDDQVLEFDSAETIDAIDDAIRALGHATDRIGHARALCARLVKGDRWDLVFNIAEGMYGRCREALVPALLDAYRIPYTFSDGLTCAVTLDKAVAKKLVHAAGIPTPRFRVISATDELHGLDLAFPVFAKPVAEGTGKGVTAASRIESPAMLAGVCAELLRLYAQPVLIEEYLPGREFTVGVWGTDDDARVVGAMEVLFNGNAAAAYTAHVKKHYLEHVRYARVPESALRNKLCALALGAYRALECRDAARVDARCDAGGEPSFIEINPLAGLHPVDSDLVILSKLEGMSYGELVGGIVQRALARAGVARAGH
ncbi:D-alanine--D-alanine ligase [bacterium]|nr:D-alanine--D-alanine ligase [bacterium]